MTNPGELKVNLAEMEEFIAYVIKRLTILDEHLIQLDNVIDLLTESWKGEAATAQKENHDILRKSYEKLYNSLESKRKNLEHAHAQYTKAIERSARLTAHI